MAQQQHCPNRTNLILIGCVVQALEEVREGYQYRQSHVKPLDSTILVRSLQSE